MTVEIDRDSGFCGGVIRAITMAEKRLSERGGSLYSLGAMVHNEAELSRLSALGLVTVDLDEAGKLAPGSAVIIRAHGEPPAVYERLEKAGLEIIDCTCPVVLKLQKNIREAYSHIAGTGGKILIFGKIGHPEVLGLVGQVGGDAIVVENLDQLKQRLASGIPDTGAVNEVFSQTTMSPADYEELCTYLKSVSAVAPVVHKTICSQVATRHSRLSAFASSHDVVVFVSGTQSSNGKVLLNLCKSANPRTHHIVSSSQLRPEWFDGASSAGVCGATSTPKWLLEEVACAIENLQ